MKNKLLICMNCGEEDLSKSGFCDNCEESLHKFMNEEQKEKLNELLQDMKNNREIEG